MTECRSLTPIAGTRPLSPYRGIMAVDAVGYSRQLSIHQPDLSATIPTLLERAFDRIGLATVWRSIRFPQDSGDGYAFGVDPQVLPFLVHPLLDELHAVLAEEDRRLRAEDRNLRLRLRASINVGPIPDSGDPLRDRKATPTNDTFRVLDSPELKRILAEANPDVTFLAAAVSQRVYEDVVCAGYTGLHAETFVPITAEVPGKDFAKPAWVYVPRPTGSAARSAGPAASVRSVDEQSGEGTTAAPAAGTSNVVHGDVAQALSVQHLHGGIRQGTGIRKNDTRRHPEKRP